MRRQILLGLICSGACLGGEAENVRTYQPVGIGGEIEIVPVIGEDWNAASGIPSVDLIGARNVPPTNAPRPAENINLAYELGIRLSCQDGEAGQFVIEIDGRAIKTPLRAGELKVVGATLECLRLMEQGELEKMEIRAVLKPAGQEEIGKLIEAFRKHPKDRPFPWKELAEK